MILFQPNFLYMFPMVVHTKFTHWHFDLSNLKED